MLHKGDALTFRLFLDPDTGRWPSTIRSPINPVFPQRLAMLQLSRPKAEAATHTVDTYPRPCERSMLNAQVDPALQTELARSVHVKMMAELTASIAHEICQPLLGIAANAAASLRWLQRDSPDLDEAIAGLKDIRAGCERAANIVKSLGALARQSPLQPRALKIDEVIGEAIAIASPALTRHRAQLETALKADAFIVADPIQLQQLVFNLITNALEATAGFRAEGGTLLISSSLYRGGVEVCVDDNGPGIPDDQREQIFTAFYTTKNSGLGIGLAICRSVIEAHKGQLWVETSDSGGARIRFRLPGGCEVR